MASLLIVGMVLVCLVAAGVTRATEPPAQATALFAEPKGEYDLESLTPEFRNKANRERWLAVLERLKAATMPPKVKPRPPLREVETLADWIGRQSAAAQTAEGRVVSSAASGVTHAKSSGGLVDCPA